MSCRFRKSSLCRIARRKRCWRRAKDRRPRAQRKSKASFLSEPGEAEELAFFVDSLPDSGHATVEDPPFFLDVAPDVSMAPAAPQSSQPAAVPEEPAVQRDEAPREEVDEMPRQPLAFTVIPSTASAPEALEAAWDQEEEQEMEHESLDHLDRFYRENEAKRGAERKRFVAPRYYEGDKTDGSALRTDDGYLTRLGSKMFCMVCFGTGHRAQHCPESRCWVCFATGHNVKNCPRAKEKCVSCWRKGHGGDHHTACPFGTLKSAQRHRDQWSHVRCAVCREPGHPMCDGSGQPFLAWWDDAEPAGPRKDDTQKAQRFAAALRGSGQGAWSTGRSNWDEQKWKQDRWNHSHDWTDRERSDRWRNDGWRDHHSPRQGHYGHQGHHGHHGERSTVPSMKIRDKPSARAEQRAAEKLKRRLR